MIMHARPVLVPLRRKRRGFGQVDCTSPGASYYAQKGNVGTNLCSPLDSSCVAQVGDAITQFQDEWDACLAAAAGPTQAAQFLSVAQQSNDPFVNAIKQQITTVQSNPPGTALHPAPPVATGGYIWPVGVSPPPGITVAGPGAAAPLSATSGSGVMVAPSPTVVNPSPASQSTATGTAAVSPISVVSQANGQPAPAATGGLISTVQGYLTNPAQDLITGVPNWGLLLAAGAGVVLIIALSRGRR